LTDLETLPRWFEKLADQQTAFYINSVPILPDADTFKADANELLGGTFSSFDTDASIPVTIIRLDVNAPTGYFPREVTLIINFRQMDSDLKEIVLATMNLNNFDSDSTNTAYNLTIQFVPLGYFALIDAFAFDGLVYSALFVIVGFFCLLVVWFFWFVHRMITRVKIPPALRIRTFLWLTMPQILIAICYVVPPVMCIILLLSWLVEPSSMNSLDILGPWGGTFDTIQLFVSDDMDNIYRPGRFATGLLTMVR
jgi:hypothetical protein